MTTGPFPVRRVLFGLLHREVDGEWVHPIHLPGRNREAEATGAQPGFGRGLGDVGRDGIAVVLDEEHEGQLPRGRQVHCLQNRSNVDGTVSEIGRRQIPGSALQLRPGVPGRHRDAAADDCVRAESSRFPPLQVHGAAPALAVAVSKPQDFGEGAIEDFLDGGRDFGEGGDPLAADEAECLGEELMVAAVRAVDRISRAHSHDGPHGPALLPNAGVCGAVHEALSSELEYLFLEGADEVELAQHGAEQGRVCVLPVCRSGVQLDPRLCGREANVLRHVNSLAMGGLKEAPASTPKPGVRGARTPSRQIRHSYCIQFIRSVSAFRGIARESSHSAGALGSHSLTGGCSSS